MRHVNPPDRPTARYYHAGSGRIVPIRRFSLPNRPEIALGDALAGGEGLLDGGVGGVATGGKRGKALALLGLALAHFGRRGLDGDAGITNELVLGTVDGGEVVFLHDAVSIPETAVDVNAKQGKTREKSSGFPTTVNLCRAHARETEERGGGTTVPPRCP